jgi:hypothetical protein
MQRSWFSLGVSSRISNSRRPTPPQSCVSDRVNCNIAATASSRTLANSRSMRRRTLAGLAFPAGASDAIVPARQLPATAMVQLNNPSALA